MSPCKLLVLAGRQITVDGMLPDRLASATVHVTLERPSCAEPDGVDKGSGPSTENCARANNFILTTANANLTGSHFTCALTPPSVLPWTNLVLRATAATLDESALGVLSLPVGR